MASYRGHVSIWKDSNGYGFMKVDGYAHDAFLHISELRNSGVEPPIKTGEKFVFDLKHEDGRGPRAVNLQRAAAE